MFDTSTETLLRRDLDPEKTDELYCEAGWNPQPDLLDNCCPGCGGMLVRPGRPVAELVQCSCPHLWRWDPALECWSILFPDETMEVQSC